MKEAAEGKDAAAVVSAPLVFDPDSELYMANACCELLHYKYPPCTGPVKGKEEWGTLRHCPYVVGVLEVLMMAGAVVINYFWWERVGLELVGGIAIGIQALLGLLFVAAILLMCLAMAIEKPNLLWPHMIIQVPTLPSPSDRATE